jgi:predicted DNA-binding protein with PD1-like motif
MIQHPGIPSSERFYTAQGAADARFVWFKKGDHLLAAINQVMGSIRPVAGFVSLKGLKFSVCSYFIPASSPDDQHVAWYSDARAQYSVGIVNATAVIGIKDGAWFAHCHAQWQSESGEMGMGHLNCAECVIDEDCQLELHIFSGAALEVLPDEETGFSLMTLSRRQPEAAFVNAVLLTIRPHQDLRHTVNRVASQFNIESGHLMGVGSLIGAEFNQAPSMHDPLSEVVVLPGAVIENRQLTRLPIACVDSKAAIFQGDLKPGGGPILITAELLLVVAR